MLLVALAFPAIFIMSHALTQGSWTRGFNALGSRAGLEIPVSSAADVAIARPLTAQQPDDRSRKAETVARTGVELSVKPTEAAVGTVSTKPVVTPSTRQPGADTARGGNS